MCGILGVVHREPATRAPLGSADLALLAHRGPDGSGTYADRQALLGHTRLAIIDLTEAGRQPMVSPDGRYVVTFNGEIYNHIELRVELEALGECFVTHSDTEVLLSAYKVWGRDCVQRFRGMFAFALWDAVDHTLFLARDRCGEKPLFYWRDAGRIVFASELKALIPLLDKRPSLDPSMVDLYLHYQYVPEPHTLLLGVHKLPPAHTMFLVDADWSAAPRRYWDVEDIADNVRVPDSEADILAGIRDGLEDAVRMTLRADVPVAVALSGGIDSGAIAALAQKHYPEPMHAFCVGYPGRPPYDERDQARALAESLGMIVHEVELPVQSFVDFFPDLVRIMDEPIADPAAFGHYSVPKAAADLGIKVLLTGIGGDEVFWGYPWVTSVARTNQLLARNPLLGPLSRWAASAEGKKRLGRIVKYRRTPACVRRWIDRLHGLEDTRTPAGQLRFAMAMPEFDNVFRLKQNVYGERMDTLAHDNPFSPTQIGRRGYSRIPAAVIRMLFDTWLASNCLSLGDRVSMGVGVETRLPFLDVKLIQLIMAMRARHPDHALGQKAWLRAALRDVLSEEVLARPKASFRPPVEEWLMGVIAAYGDALLEGKMVAEGILDREKMRLALSGLAKQGRSGMFFVYKLVLLEVWCRKVVDA
ncbi:asparagine synthase (glutamine-hydrolyzing) [Nitratidesulfovibrio sp. D1]|uniref:asparagine synthase (glutamine-hydrolyzing) n=1 Tax=Nitratidesulfovibrio sp. D1 TaxID=3440151 RepID=UPI003EBB8C56